MARFPKLTSPCPYKSQAMATMDGGTCRLCQRRVFDLMALGEAERSAFLAGCSEEICVSYSLPLRPAVAAVALAAASFSFPAAAQEPDVTAREVAMVVVVGGIRDPSRADYIETEDEADVPALPLTYEDEAPAEGPAPEMDGALPDLDHSAS